MAKIPFTYYMQDSRGRGECADAISDKTGIESEKLYEWGVGWAFSEVELSCELDTETGEVTILKAG